MDDIDRQLQDILNTYAGNVRDEVNKEVVKAAADLEGKGQKEPYVQAVEIDHMKLKYFLDDQKIKCLT